jgi:hypothetical protein
MPFAPAIRRAAPLALAAALIAPALAPAAPSTACRGTATSWAQAARSLSFPVFRPSQLAGLRQVRLVRPDASCAGASLDARFVRPDGAALRIVQGIPRSTGAAGDAPLVSRPRVGARRASLFAYGPRHDPHRVLVLSIATADGEVGLIAERISKRDLIAIARGLRAVEGPA